MLSRRAVLSGLASASSFAGASWADAGAPSHITAAQERDQTFSLCGLRQDGGLAFRIPLPGRGHAAAAHPGMPEVVAFARRPGRYGIVLDCIDGHVIQQIEAPPGRHFFGHGAFSADGTHLFTTENAYETGEGKIGVWSRSKEYVRAGEFASGGIGPHEIIRIPGTERLAIANGGIRTHPATGREKLNLDTMRPNLSIVSQDGRILDVAEVPEDSRQNSLRHIAALPNGLVACAFQWQGDTYDAPSLLALSVNGGALSYVDLPTALHRAMTGYAGSVAFTAGGQRIGITSPRGGVLGIVDAHGSAVDIVHQPDICGIAPSATGMIATDGLGGVVGITNTFTRLSTHPVAFDNHLVRIEQQGTLGT
ncbi:MAG: DUF1513 domain-containing protein [Pseudomonadota bacterium]